MNFFALITQTAVEKINWTDKVFQKWLDSGNEAYLFLVLVILGLIAIVSALVFLFKLYIGAKDEKYAKLEKEHEELIKEKKKNTTETKLEIEKWQDRWTNKMENFAIELLNTIKNNTQASKDVAEQLESYNEILEKINNNKCSGGGKVGN